MFESLGPAVPGSPVMEDRKADLLPYLSQEAQRSRISFPGGQPELGGVLGCRRCRGSSGSRALSHQGMAELARGDWREPISVLSAVLLEARAMEDPRDKGQIILNQDSQMPSRALGWQPTSPLAPVGVPSH